MSITLIGRILKNKLDIKPQRFVDAPLRGKGTKLDKLRVGGLLNTAFAQASFVTAVTAGTLMKPPTEPLSIIHAYGKINDGDFTIHRFYFDGPANGKTDTFLQVIADSGGVLENEIKLMQKVAEINPSSAEEWDLWLGNSAGDPGFLALRTLDFNGGEYTRFWSPGSEHGIPRQYHESVESSGNSAAVDLTSMLFYRDLSGTTEWLHVSICKSGSERWVEAYVGIDVAHGELSSI